jgi:hypothetical protein
MAAGQGAAAVEGVPRWTLRAVTPTRLHAFAAHALPHVRIEEPFRVWDRDAITVRVEGRLNVKVFEVEDHGDGRRYEFEGFRWGGQHARVVMSLLTDPDDDDEHEGDAG